MSSLADFVNEQRNKSGTSNRYFNVANIGSKVSTSFNGFFKTGNVADDTERLTDETPAQNGQLPSSRNRFAFYPFEIKVYCIYFTDAWAIG